MFEGFVKDENAISQIVVVALLIAVALVGVAVIASFMGGLMTFNKMPEAQFKIADHPDVVTATGAKAFVVRHLGGDRINFNDIILVVYDSNKNVLFNNVVDPTDTTNFTVNQLSSPGYSDSFFEGGEQIAASNTVLGATPAAGTYEIVLYYKPTMQPMADQEVMIS